MRKTLPALCGALALLVIQAGAAAPPTTVTLGTSTAAFTSLAAADGFVCGGLGQTACPASFLGAPFPVTGGAQARWGSPAGSSQTGLAFFPTDGTAALGQNVQLGEIKYVNTAVGGAVNSMLLDETIPVATPSGPGTFHLSIPLTVDQTPNAEPCAYPSDPGDPCADALKFPSAIAGSSFTLAGKTYTLTVVGFTNSPTSTTPEDHLVVQENKTDDGFLIGFVTRSNQAPVAADDPGITVASGDTFSIPVTANDSDPDGDAFAPDTVSAPTHGTAVINGSNIDYTAPVNYAGPVTFTYTDADGFGARSNAATVSITVKDETKPVLTVPGDITQEATGPSGAAVGYTATATDNVDGSLTPSCTPGPGTFPLGTTTVHCTVTDGGGNTATASFNVTVQDTTPPTLAPHPDVAVEANAPHGANVTYTNPTATDIVDPAPTVNCAPSGFFPLGTTLVTCTATDASHNTSAPQTFNVTVKDTTPPTLTVPGPINVTATSPTGTAVSYSVSATDVADPSPGIVCSTPSGSTFPLGTTTVKCTATDASGNSTAKTFTVTVGNPLDALILYANGLKPGNSFPAKAQNIKASWLAGNNATACSQLAALVNEAKAQSGKQLTVAQAGQLLSLAAAAGTFLGC